MARIRTMRNALGIRFLKIALKAMASAIATTTKNQALIRNFHLYFERIRIRVIAIAKAIISEIRDGPAAISGGCIP